MLELDACTDHCETNRGRAHSLAAVILWYWCWAHWVPSMHHWHFLSIKLCCLHAPVL